jgi:hypothetical protein
LQGSALSAEKVNPEKHFYKITFCQITFYKITFCQILIHSGRNATLKIGRLQPGRRNFRIGLAENFSDSCGAERVASLKLILRQ